VSIATPDGPGAESASTADHDVTAAIREAIVRGRFAPNQRLIEPDLCVQFDASRAAIRLALFELAAEGIVERTLNRGARVRAIGLDEAVEILEVRAQLERLCAVRAAERITDEERDELRTLKDAILAAVANVDLVEYSRLNELLDARVRTISRQATAVELLERLRAKVVRQQYRLAFQPGRAAESGPQHAAIIDAIVDRDPVAADEATRVHLESVVEAMRKVAAAGGAPDAAYRFGY
jgi:DNA-binding GntR family transcriptional regulator